MTILFFLDKLKVKSVLGKTSYWIDSNRIHVDKFRSSWYETQFCYNLNSVNFQEFVTI